MFTVVQLGITEPGLGILSQTCIHLLGQPAAAAVAVVAAAAAVVVAATILAFDGAIYQVFKP